MEPQIHRAAATKPFGFAPIIPARAWAVTAFDWALVQQHAQLILDTMHADTRKLLWDAQQAAPHRG